MILNPILAEIYAAREQILAEHDGDVAAYLRSANERAKASGHPIAKLKQRTIRHTGTMKSEVLKTDDRSIVVAQSIQKVGGDVDRDQ